MGEQRDRQPEREREGEEALLDVRRPDEGDHRGGDPHACEGRLVQLGTRYTKKGCTTASEMTLEHLESKPGKYWVCIDTKSHPGDLRGKLFAGMAHM